MKETNFEKWFDEQFGKRPSTKSIPELQAEAEATRIASSKAEVILQFTEEWERRRDAALKAKVAFEKGVSHA